VKEYLWQRKLIALLISVILLVFGKISPEIFRDIAIVFMGANALEHLANGISKKFKKGD